MNCWILMMEKNLKQLDGFVNRHTNGLPSESCVIKIINKDVEGEHTYLCEWMPVDSNNDERRGYLGTANIISGSNKGIGFHAWEENNSEFVHYLVLTI